MNETNLSEMRRQYPRNHKGGKEEWRGLIQHQQSINDEITKTEIGIKALKSNLLMTEIQKQQLEVLQKRQQELEIKKKDTEEVLRKHQQYLEVKLENINLFKNKYICKFLCISRVFNI